MNRTRFAKSVTRRSVLSAVGAGHNRYVDPALASARSERRAATFADRASPVRYDCRTRFFPTGGTPTSFMLPEITKPFEPLLKDMVLLSGVTCPRCELGRGNTQPAITMMSGKRFVATPGTNDLSMDTNAKTVVAADATFDQYLLAQVPSLVANFRSLQTTAYHPSTLGLPSFKVMSYQGYNQPLARKTTPRRSSSVCSTRSRSQASRRPVTTRACSTA